MFFVLYQNLRNTEIVKALTNVTLYNYNILYCYALRKFLGLRCAKISVLLFE